MKELTKKILEAGLVDKHMALAMERWGLLDRGASETVGTCPVTKDSLEKFADDIALLVEAEQPIREAVLDIEGDIVQCRYRRYHFVGIMDKLGNLIVQTATTNPIFVEGNVIEIDRKDLPNDIYEVDSVEPIYVNEEVKAHRLSIARIDVL